MTNNKRKVMVKYRHERNSYGEWCYACGAYRGTDYMFLSIDEARELRDKLNELLKD